MELAVVSLRRDHLLGALGEAIDALEREVPASSKQAAAERLRTVVDHVLEEEPSRSSMIAQGIRSTEDVLRGRIRSHGGNIERALAAGAITVEEARMLRAAERGDKMDARTVRRVLAKLVAFLSAQARKRRREARRRWR